MVAGGEHEVDELLARVQTVDEPTHTARRVVGLVVALVGIGAAVAVGVTSGASAVLFAVVRAGVEHWADQV